LTLKIQADRGEYNIHDEQIKASRERGKTASPAAAGAPGY